MLALGKYTHQLYTHSTWICIPLQVTEYIQMASHHLVVMDTHNVTSVVLYYLDQNLAALEVSTETISTSKVILILLFHIHIAVVSLPFFRK